MLDDSVPVNGRIQKIICEALRGIQIIETEHNLKMVDEWEESLLSISRVKIGWGCTLRTIEVSQPCARRPCG
jgi:glycyl-tRNA synthetase alpha subunit